MKPIKVPDLIFPKPDVPDVDDKIKKPRAFRTDFELRRMREEKP
jgi:hypothetical protein